MRNVLLVDDEPWVIEGLRTIVNWSKHGFQVCGEAANGITALALIEQLQPELVLTDIHMPAVDGLELIGQSLKQMAKPPRFVILSGYDDFGYALTALQHKVEDYLLKPIDEDEIESLLHQIGRKLEDADVRERHQRRNCGLYANNLLNRLIHGEDNSPELEREAAGLLNISPGQEVYCLLAESGLDEKEQRQDLQGLQEMLGTASGHLFIDCEGRPGLMVCGNKETADRLEEQGHLLYGKWSEVSSTPVIVSLSGGLQGIASVRPLYIKALEGLNCKRYQKKGGLVSTIRLRETCCRMELNKGHLDELIVCVDENRMDRVPEAVERALLPAAGLADIDYVRLQLSSLELGLCKKIRETNGDADVFMLNLRREFGTLTAMEGYPAYKSYAVALCVQAASFLMKQRAKNEKSTVYQVIQYVDREYRGKLQLQDLSRIFHLNSNYLGQLFKQQTGKSFREYLNDRRIEESKRLLKHSRMSITEVALEVGYPNADYFICQFKRKTGMVPSAFKRLE